MISSELVQRYVFFESFFVYSGMFAAASMVLTFLFLAKTVEGKKNAWLRFSMSLLTISIIVFLISFPMKGIYTEKAVEEAPFSKLPVASVEKSPEGYLVEYVYNNKSKLHTVAEAKLTYEESHISIKEIVGTGTSLDKVYSFELFLNEEAQ